MVKLLPAPAVHADLAAFAALAVLCREVGMDRWASDQLNSWIEIRRQLPIGALLCVIHGPTAGRRWEASAARKQLHRLPQPASDGDSRRTSSATHTPSRWLTKAFRSSSSSGNSEHANLGISSVYLQDIDSSEIIRSVHGRPSPTISATAGLQLRR